MEQEQFLKALKKEAHLYLAFSHKHADPSLLASYLDLLSGEEREKFTSFFLKKTATFTCSPMPCCGWLFQGTQKFPLAVGDLNIIFMDDRKLPGWKEMCSSISVFLIRMDS